MPAFEIIGADQPHTLDAERDVAAAATFLLGEGAYELREQGGGVVVPPLATAESPLAALHREYGVDVNAVLRERRPALLAALTNVQPASGNVGVAARRLARVLQVVHA